MTTEATETKRLAQLNRQLNDLSAAMEQLTRNAAQQNKKMDRLSQNIGMLVDLLSEQQRDQRAETQDMHQLLLASQRNVERSSAILRAFGSVSIDAERAAEINGFNIYNMSKTEDALQKISEGVAVPPRLVFDSRALHEFLSALTEELGVPLKDLVTGEVKYQVRQAVEDGLADAPARGSKNKPRKMAQIARVSHAKNQSRDEEHDNVADSFRNKRIEWREKVVEFFHLVFSKRGLLITAGVVGVLILLSLVGMLLPKAGFLGVLFRGCKYLAMLATLAVGINMIAHGGDD